MIQSATPPPQLPPPQPHLLLDKPRRKSRLAWVIAGLLILFALIAIVGIVMRMIAAHRLATETQRNAVQKVSVIEADPGAAVDTVALPGTIEAWHAATIYARVPGYLKRWNFDIGAQVRQGDVLAEIDTPELDAQVRQARADLGTAEANNALAQVTAKRWVELLKSDSVSRQDADSKVAAANADAAIVASAKANLDHLIEEEGFKRVTAPFDGTITQRNTDVGALINGTNPGTTTTVGQTLFQIADTSKLRVYVQVPETYTSAIKPDLAASLHVPQHPDQEFPATLSRSANALDPVTRTVQIELEIDNSSGDLLAGGYADVHIKVPAPFKSVILPVNTLLFRDGMKAGVVLHDQNGDHVALRPIKIGKDYGKSVQVVDGIQAGDRIVINPPDSLEDNQPVEIVQPDAKDKDKNGDGNAGDSDKGGGQPPATNQPDNGKTAGDKTNGGPAGGDTKDNDGKDSR